MASKFSRNEWTRYDDEMLRIVLVGKTGVGKSATANTILGKTTFRSRFSPKSVTVKCSKATGDVGGQKVAVIDTPGLFDTDIKEGQTTRDIIQCISFAAPGPHIFLIVIKLDRYTEEEKKSVQKIQEIFGEDSHKYSMVLFTRGDQLKGVTIEEFLMESEELQELVARCNNQYHVFNNELNDPSQVRELLDKIRGIAGKNGGSHYTTEMFQSAEKAIEEEKERILKEKEEEMRKEQEKMMKEVEEKFARQMKEVTDDLQKQKQIREDQKREMDMMLERVKREQAEQARREAEESQSIFDKIGKFFKSLFSW